MTADFKSRIENNIPAKYVYISRNIYTVKGVPMYLVYYNSRIPNTKISKSVIAKQHTVTIQGMFGTTIQDIRFEPPLLIDEYSREIRPNSILVFIDIAGGYISKPNTL